MRSLIYILITLTVGSGCRPEQNLNQEHESKPEPAQSAVSTVSINQPQATETPLEDTLFIFEKGVVFFTPTASELQNISWDQGTSEGVSMAVGDFAYYASIMADSLERQDISAQFTSSKYIVYPLESSPLTIDRTEGNALMGLAMFDGENAPEVIYGFHTHLSIWAAIQDYFQVNQAPELPLLQYFQQTNSDNLHIYSSHSDILNQRGQRIDPAHHDKFGTSIAGRASKYRMSLYGYYKFNLRDSLVATVCRVPSRYDESAVNLYIWDQQSQKVRQRLPLAENLWNDHWIMVMDSWINAKSNGDFEIIQRKKEARMKDGQRQEWDSLYRWVWKGQGLVRASTGGLAKRSFPLKDWASYQEPAAPAPLKEITITEEDFVWLPLETGDLTWENVILEIPKPYTLEKEPIANQINQYQIDTIFTLKQKGLEFKFYHTPDQRYIIGGTITNNSLGFKNGLQVGISKPQFQSLFQKLSDKSTLPDQVKVRSRQGDRVFSCYFESDTLVRIELTNYLH